MRLQTASHSFYPTAQRDHLLICCASHPDRCRSLPSSVAFCMQALTAGVFDAQLSKKCPFVIATNLDPVSGNATWKIANTVPYATYSLRALVYTNVTVNGKVTPKPIATGVSVGYFQVSSRNRHWTAQKPVTNSGGLQGVLCLSIPWLSGYMDIVSRQGLRSKLLPLTVPDNQQPGHMYSMLSRKPDGTLRSVFGWIAGHDCSRDAATQAGKVVSIEFYQSKIAVPTCNLGVVGMTTLSPYVKREATAC